MKKIVVAFGFIFFLFVSCRNSSNTSIKQDNNEECEEYLDDNSNGITGTFNDIKLEIDNENEKLKVFVSCDVSGAKGASGQIAFYLYDYNKKPWKDLNDNYCTSDGEVAAHKDITPNYENSSYKDFCITIPFSECHFDNINRMYYIKASLFIEHEEICESEYVSFDAYKINGHDEDCIYCFNGSCQFCLGTGLCTPCGGAGGYVVGGTIMPCTGCLGSGDCQVCKGLKICLKCKGKGQNNIPTIYKVKNKSSEYCKRSDDESASQNSNGSPSVIYVPSMPLENDVSTSSSNNEYKCSDCHGSGRCSYCAGRGWTKPSEEVHDCWKCHGTGYCHTCYGKGTIR